jgi:hypothetical protein
MCCFSKPVESVTTTRIFARAENVIRQLVVYRMTISTSEELAMVLPIPVRRGTDEKGVKFIDLSKYPSFFMDLEAGFKPPPTTPNSGDLTVWFSVGLLEVQQVGDYEASFVPTIKDFSRLDERFRLPAGTWEKLPAYRNYGFAVFKLKPGTLQKPGSAYEISSSGSTISGSGASRKLEFPTTIGTLKPSSIDFHPMAFSFPSADITSLFFPTIHIHDGKVHDQAHFDHVLYCQNDPRGKLSVKDWRESSKLARDFVQLDMAKGIVAGEQHCYRKELKGTLPNRDIILS